MSSPGQKRGSCGHAMAIFDGHAFCARCREKGKGEEPCVTDKDTVDCSLCNSFTPEQRAQISTPSYKIKKEKREAKRADITQPTDELVDPSSVSVIGVVSGPSSDRSPVPPEKKAKKDKPSVKPKISATSTLSSATEDKFTALEDKWSERFNRLEALLLAKSMEPTFSSDVRVAPTHSAPSNVTHDSEPFFQPPNPSGDSSQRTGPDSSAALQPSAGKLVRDSSVHGSSSSERTGPDNVASQQKSAGKLKVKSTSQGRTGPDTASQKHKSTGKPGTDFHRPTTVLAESSKQPVTDHPPSDRPLAPPALLHRPFRRAGRTAFLAWIQIQIVKSLISLRWNSLQRRGTFRKIKILNRNYRLQRNRHTGRPCEAYDPLWVGRISLTWTVQTHLTTTPSLGPKLQSPARSQSRCLQRIIFVASYPNSISP